jgi:protein-disulfide isomerase-like protein with CxxC motif
VPNYWDTIKKEVGKAIGTAVGAPIKAAIGLAGGMTQARVAPMAPKVAPDFAANERALADRVTQEFGQKYVNTLAKPAEVVRADVAFNLAAEEIDKLYTAVRPIVTRPISTALLAEADNISGEG